MADRYVSRAEIADRLNLSERRITQLVDETLGSADPFPSRVAGRSRTFPVGACFDWYLEFKIREAMARAAASGPTDAYQDAVKAEARLKVVKAEQAELDLAERKAQLVTLDFMADEFGRVLQKLRARCEVFPAAWAGRLGACRTDLDRQLLLEQAIAELMATLRSEVEGDEPPDPARDDDADGPAPDEEAAA